jgi:hypothetical protein
MLSFNKEVRFRVRRRAGFNPRGSWIADVKEQLGMPMRRSPKRVGERKYPCPPEKRDAIVEAIRATMA